MTPARLLFTIPNFETAGSGRALVNIVSRLDRERFAPTVCVLRHSGRLEQELQERWSVPVIEAPFCMPARPYRSFSGRAKRAARAFKPHGFALWHSFHYLDDYSEPVIARLAGARAWIYTKKNMSWNRRSWFVRSLLASRILAQNTDMLTRFFAGPLLGRKARLVPRGVDADRFNPGVPPRLGLRSSLSIPGSDIVCACVAELVPVKGHPTLLEALAQVPGVHLLAAGRPLDQPYADRLRQAARELGITERVHFLGGVDDVPALLAEADIFALATWARWRMEGCPVALLEAMAMARACVATHVPGSRDLVEHDRSGILVAPEDAGALAEALRSLAASPERRSSLGAAARQRVLERFSVGHEVRAHEDLYREVLGP